MGIILKNIEYLTGFLRCRPWDQNLRATSLFEGWSQETPLVEWGVRQGKKSCQKIVCDQVTYYCEQMESNLTKELNEAIKNAPQSYPRWGMRTLGLPSTLHWSLVEGYFCRHYIASTFALSSPWAKCAPVARDFPTLTLIQWGREGGPYLSTHAVPSLCRLTGQHKDSCVDWLTPETILGRERA